MRDIDLSVRIDKVLLNSITKNFNDNLEDNNDKYYREFWL